MCKKKKKSILNITITRIFKFFVFVLVIALGGSCETYFDSEAAVVSIKDEANTDNVELLTEGWSIAAFPGTDTPYLYVTDDKKVVAANDKDLNGVIDGVYLESGIESVLIDFDETTKLPLKLATSNNEIIVFSFSEDITNLNLAFILNDGSISYVKGITIDPFDYSYDFFSFSNKNLSNKVGLPAGFALVAKISSFMVSATACGLSTAVALGGTVPTFGASLVTAGAAAILSCTGAAFSLLDVSLSLAKYAGADDIPEGIFLGLTMNGVLFDGTLCFGAKDPYSCTNLILNAVATSSDLLEGTVDANSELIETAEDELSNRYGDISFYFQGTIDFCGCNGSTITVDFGNGYSITIAIGSSERIALKEGTYEITVRDSNGNTGSQTLEVNSDNFQIAWYCYCNSDPGNKSKSLIHRLEKFSD